MQIAYHIGANCTDEDRLLKSILKNTDTLLEQGIAVPGPSRYRSLIRETIQNLGTEPPVPGTREILLESIVENDSIDRLVLCNDNFICIPKRIFDHGVFYPQAELKVRGLHRLFPTDEISLYLGIRNPVTFLQEVFQRAKAPDLQTYLGFMQPDEIRWSDVVKRIKAGAPETHLTVWCNEDSPVLWDQIMRQLTGVAQGTHLTGAADLLSTLLSADGMTVYDQAMASMPHPTDDQRHELIADLWDTHALPQQIEDEIDLLDFPAALVDNLTAAYETDIDRIDAMEGVTLLMPFR